MLKAKAGMVFIVGAIFLVISGAMFVFASMLYILSFVLRYKSIKKAV